MGNQDLTNVFYLGYYCQCILIECSIDNITTTGSVSLDTILIGTKSFINGLTFIETGSCLSKFDQIEDNENITVVFNNSQYQYLESSAISLSNNLYVVNCYFYLITYSGDGAAIYLDGNYHFLVEFSTFVECSAFFGGGLYISQADFAMNYVCAIECKAYIRSSFTFVTNSGRTVNSIHHSSIAYCFAKDLYTMFHWCGYIDIQSVNISHNTASSYSALDCAPDKPNENDIGTSISYSSFADNNVTFSMCIDLNYAVSHSEASTYKISNSNILRNTGYFPIHLFRGELTMINTCIMGNQDFKNVFYLVYDDCKCTIIECSIDNITTTGSGSLDTILIGTNSFINGLTFIETGSCLNTFDTIGGLAPSNIQAELFPTIGIINQYHLLIILSLFIILFFC